MDEQKETERAQLCRRNEEIRNERQALTREELANDRRIRELDGQPAPTELCHAAGARIAFADRQPGLCEEVRRYQFEASADDEPVRGGA